MRAMMASGNPGRKFRERARSTTASHEKQNSVGRSPTHRPRHPARSRRIPPGETLPTRGSCDFAQDVRLALRVCSRTPGTFMGLGCSEGGSLQSRRSDTPAVGPVPVMEGSAPTGSVEPRPALHRPPAYRRRGSTPRPRRRPRSGHARGRRSSDAQCDQQLIQLPPPASSQ